MMRRQRRYSEETKRTTLAVLQSNGGNLTETSNQTGIPLQTIFSWREGTGINGAVLQGIQERRRELAEFMGKVVAKALNILPYKLERAGVKDTALAVAILVD
jgi:transposase-like protein